MTSDLWTEESIFHDGDHFFSALLRALTHAQHSIDLETYIFDRDSLGNQVLDRLQEAANRGVTVRLLLDGFGCAQWTHHDLVALRRRGIQVRCYHPLPWQTPPFRWLHAVRFRKIILGLWKLNRRNHRKTCIVDGQIAFLGGMNISARHSKALSGASVWRDTSVQVRGSGVARLQAALGWSWNHPASVLQRWVSGAPGHGTSRFVRLNQTQRQRHIAYRDLLRRIGVAKSRVWITNPYFSPELSLIRQLRAAAERGVDVQLLLPSRLEPWGVKWAAKAFYQILLLGRVKIHEYTPSLLHAKTVLIDRWALVGSSNLNHRSLLHDLEVDIVLRKTQSIDSLAEDFEGDVAASREIDLVRWMRRPWVLRMFEKLALVFKRWI